MKNILAISSLTLCFAITTMTAASADKPVDTTDLPPMEIFLLVGQSNMAGRGVVEEADRQPVDRLLVLNRENEWTSQGEPIHFDKPQAGVGLGFQFGRLMTEKDSEKVIGLVPCAVGGTPIDRWKPGGDLFKEAVKRAKLAMEHGELRGILWHQGEGSSRDEERTSVYLSELSEVIAGFREALDAPEVPFIAGELGEFLYTRPRNPWAKEFNERLRALPERVKNTAVVSSAGLVDGGDQLHFDAPSLKEFGTRYFQAYEELRGE